MSNVATHSPLISPEEYLAGEEIAETKHEYLNGVVYAMAGGTSEHSTLAVNLIVALGPQLRGGHCRIFNSDLLVRVERDDDHRFYYPDATILCGHVSKGVRVVEHPTVLFEVLSESTERIDTGEKRAAYLTIPLLEAYVIVASQRREVTVWRRGERGWSAEVHTAPEAKLAFAKAGCALTVAEIYEETGL